MLKATISYTHEVAIADADLPKNWEEMSGAEKTDWLIEQGLRSMNDVGADEVEIWNDRATLNYRRPGR